MTQVKICGITNLEDALLSQRFGADILGFNFYEKSPRYIEPRKAREIIEQLSTKVEKVGVFVNEAQEKVSQTVELCGLDAIQLHGDELPEYIDILDGIKIIKAFRLSPGVNTTMFANYKADSILLDALSSTGYGGTGQTCDWDLASDVAKTFPKVFLSGGLGADNVAEAIRTVRPYAVDACSRLESAKGKKDFEKLEKFIIAAKHL